MTKENDDKDDNNGDDDNDDDDDDRDENANDTFYKYELVTWVLPRIGPPNAKLAN